MSIIARCTVMSLVSCQRLTTQTSVQLQLFTDSCADNRFIQMGEPVDKDLWGELEPEEGLLFRHQR
jgi:hypothetical protein